MFYLYLLSEDNWITKLLNNNFFYFLFIYFLAGAWAGAGAAKMGKPGAVQRSAALSATLRVS